MIAKAWNFNTGFFTGMKNRWCGGRAAEYIPEGYDYLAQVTDAFYGILDSGCTHSCAGERWIENYLEACRQKYGTENVHWERKERAVKFRFGNGTRETSA